MLYKGLKLSCFFLAANDPNVTQSMSKVLWSSVSIGVATLLLAIIIVVFKQKRWRKAKYRLNVEVRKDYCLHAWLKSTF